MLWQSESFQTVQDIAISFVSRLATTGRSGPSAKPLIFLAHSLGGLVLKHALLQLANSVQRRHIFDAVQAVIFFGVPHGGMTISHLQSMVGGQPNRTLVDDLRPESTYLRVLDEQFSGLANQSLRIFSVFETKRSPTVQVLFLLFSPLTQSEKIIATCGRELAERWTIRNPCHERLRYSPMLPPCRFRSC